MKTKMKSKGNGPPAVKKNNKFNKKFKNKNQKKINPTELKKQLKPVKQVAAEDSESSDEEIIKDELDVQNEAAIEQMQVDNPPTDEEDSEPEVKKPAKKEKKLKKQKVEKVQEVSTAEKKPVKDAKKVAEKAAKKLNKSKGDEAAGGEQEGEEKFKYDKADEKLTVFCGNIPNGSEVNKAKIKELFSKYGPIKSMRIRSEGGKVIYNKKMMNKTENFNAYIVYEKEEDAQKSIELNGHEILGHHLRVNMANSKNDAFSNKGTIFVGNVPFEATEAEIHDFFSPVGKIEYVRKIPKRGIAYVRFDKGVDIVKALKMNDQVLGGRNIRVSRCESKQKQEKKKMFKKDEKTGKFNKQRVKKAHKIKDNVLMSGRANNNPIIKKIKDKQTAKFNKFSRDNAVSKSDVFRKGGQMDQNLKNLSREKTKKKQTFSGTKVDDINMKSKVKKNKATKMEKQQKVIVKKLKSAAARTKS